MGIDQTLLGIERDRKDHEERLRKLEALMEKVRAELEALKR
jgi:hypothetical protein